MLVGIGSPAASGQNNPPHSALFDLTSRQRSARKPLGSQVSNGILARDGQTGRWLPTLCSRIVLTGLSKGMASDSSELWWTWYVSGYKGRRLISAKANDERNANYLAKLFEIDGLTKIKVQDRGRR